MADGHRHRYRKHKVPVQSGGPTYIESEDLLIDILSRLPVKTLIQFRRVCKSWRALISSSHFATKQLSLSDRRPKLLFSVKSFQSIDIKPLNYGICQVSSSKLGLPLYVGTTLKIVGSCNGLICLLGNPCLVILWNPSTGRDARFLPMPNGFDFGSVTFYGFGYDSTIDDYKIIFGRKSNPTRVVMFQLKTKTWRSIDGLGYVNLIGQGCLVNGALHWLEMKWGAVLGSRIVSFRLTEERFQGLVPISYLSRDEKYSSARILIAEDGLLSVYIYSCIGITAWVMREYGVRESWSKVLHISFVSRYGFINPPVSSYGFINPICILENGDVLMSWEKNCMLLCNSKGWKSVLLQTPAE